MRLIKFVSGFRGRSSSPSLAVITPDWKGGTGWNFCEGWARAFKRVKQPCRVFCVGDNAAQIKKLFSTLKRNPPELILLSCGDHHLHHLHRGERNQAFWRGLKSRTVCFCNERIIESPFPLSLEKTASAIAAFDAFVYVDEFAEKLFVESGKAAVWSAQFSDETLFYPRQPFEKRKDKIYFRAHLSNFGIEGVYEKRIKLIERLRREDIFLIHDKLLSSPTYARELARQKFVLRAPANCPGYVENFWNALASGCMVFHEKLPANEARSAGLVTPNRDFIEYDLNNLDGLVKMARDATKNWGDYRHIAESGRNRFLSGFTLGNFLRKMLDFADKSVKPK